MSTRQCIQINKLLPTRPTLLDLYCRLSIGGAGRGDAIRRAASAALPPTVTAAVTREPGHPRQGGRSARARSFHPAVTTRRKIENSWQSFVRNLAPEALMATQAFSGL